MIGVDLFVFYRCNNYIRVGQRFNNPIMLFGHLWMSQDMFPSFISQTDCTFFVISKYLKIRHNHYATECFSLFYLIRAP